MTGGFGSTGFGSKPAFGSPATTSGTGGGLFGSTTANNTSTTFGGFGNANSASTPFGGSNNTTTSGGLFGNNTANKPAFGATNNTGSSLFGGGNTNTTTTGGFGSAFGTTGTALGPGVGDPPGTAATPFQAHTEKEANNSSTNSFQNLLFQDPYKKWSGEELRLADYVQGRKHGNATGGGAFGVSSGFGGGFGATNNNTTTTTGAFGSGATSGGGLFGSSTTNNAGTGFGQTGSNAFGSTTNNNTGSSLFGNANKPASGGLFGSSSQPQQTGGLFGSTNNTSGGFGTTNTGSTFGSTATNTSGGLFGANTANQNKPAGSGFSFGNTASNNTTSGFGGNTNTAFGSTNTNTTGGGLFGNNNTNQQPAGGGLFGNNNAQQNSTAGAFGSAFGQQNQGQQQQSGGLFGNNNNTQQKPAGGLFGSSTANTTPGGGLFGGTNTQQNTGAFGSTNTASTGGGLFGGAKPATGGLFGNSTATQNTNTGGSLFGGVGANTQNQQPTTGGLFGSTNNQQQKPSLFGNSGISTGTGLFGGQNNQNQGTGLFGSSTNQQQQQQGTGFGGSLLGASQQAGNAPQGLTANLNDVSAYGTPSLFSGLGGNEVQNPGPLATPLNSNSKPRRSSILPMYKLAPSSASRFNTPQKRGFGFSYSSYGTPGSQASSVNSTPGTLGRSLLGSSSSGSLSKSVSTNNLRRSFNTEDSILAPGAFSSGSTPRWYGSQGSKKLVINRDIRSDLFSTPPKGKHPADDNTGSRKQPKRVSFNTDNVETEDAPVVRAALPAPEDVNSPAKDETPRQSKPISNGTPGSNGTKTPEMEQIKGNELAVVHEEEHAATPQASTPNGYENAPGQYWMQPPKDDLQNMNRMQRQKIDGFTVGRDNVGYVSFKVPVDISGIDLDEICGGIIQLEPRSATVYPVAAKKPPVGKGLNVPARISLEQSWPRGGRDKRVASDPKRFNKHIERLKRIENTTFESYDKDTGIWTFSVEHFTTYGLDDEDEDSDEELDNAPPISTESQQMALDLVGNSEMEEDTFEFRKRTGPPGTFDEQGAMYDADDSNRKESFLGVSSADSAPNDVRLSLEEEYAEDMGEDYELSDDEDMARSSVEQHLAAELDDVSSESSQEVKKFGTPGGILRARMRAMKDSVGPVKLEVADGDDWMEMLRKSVSPVKRDRQLLRELNESPSKQSGLLLDFGKNEGGSPRKSSIWNKSTNKNDRLDGFAASTHGLDKGRGFATSIDLMNSLFDKPKPAPQNLRASIPSKGFPKVGPLVAM